MCAIIVSTNIAVHPFQMKQKQVDPNADTYALMMQHHFVRRRPHDAYSVLSNMQQAGVKHTELSYNLAGRLLLWLSASLVIHSGWWLYSVCLTWLHVYVCRQS